MLVWIHLLFKAAVFAAELEKREEKALPKTLEVFGVSFNIYKVGESDL